MVIHSQPLTREAFMDFGDILSMDEVAPVMINAGRTKKYAGLSAIRVLDEAQANISIYRSIPVVFPFRVLKLERHPLGSQAFMPLHSRPFPVVVAPTGPAPGTADIRVFLTNGRQGVNLHPGVWHHFQLSLEEESDYLVIDRGGGRENIDECVINDKVLIRI